jgi:hypothetical protein
VEKKENSDTISNAKPMETIPEETPQKLEQGNTNLPELNSELKLKKKKKTDAAFCETCLTQEKMKLLTCYICKKAKCKSCAEKESHYSSKKRDQSSYICTACFENQTTKIR